MEVTVHEAITKHSHKQNEKVKEFLKLDMEREQHIEKALHSARNGSSFSVEEINEITAKMNELSDGGPEPARKSVTKEMIIEFASRKK